MNQRRSKMTEVSCNALARERIQLEKLYGEANPVGN